MELYCVGGSTLMVLHLDHVWVGGMMGVALCSGSGGNNHAVAHYEQTKYPLAVKLGTITPDGADVYSYDEDDMVEDPHLSQHLSHFGIDITSMSKVWRGAACREGVLMVTPIG